MVRGVRGVVAQVSILQPEQLAAVYSGGHDPLPAGDVAVLIDQRALDLNHTVGRDARAAQPIDDTFGRAPYGGVDADGLPARAQDVARDDVTRARASRAPARAGGRR